MDRLALVIEPALWFGPVMRSIVVLLVATACLSGCGNDEDTCLDCFGFLELSWTLATVDGTPVASCPAGFDVVVVKLEPTDGSKTAPPPQRYPCNDMTGSKDYDGGFYDLAVDVESSGGQVRDEVVQPGIQIPILGDHLDLDIQFTVP